MAKLCLDNRREQRVVQLKGLKDHSRVLHAAQSRTSNKLKRSGKSEKTMKSKRLLAGAATEKWLKLYISPLAVKSQ